MSDAHALVLASASERRSALLRAAGVAFEIDVPEVDESVPAGTAPEAAAVLLAERKARAVAARHAQRGAIVLAADTIVAVDREGGTHLLGKPEDERDAARMLAWLSGTRHRVVTGVCALVARGGAPQCGYERTWVTMRPITAGEIAGYVASGEWRGKAGGYAIQESADRFVTGLAEGGHDNVVGLPVRLALELVARAERLASGRAGG